MILRALRMALAAAGFSLMLAPLGAVILLGQPGLGAQLANPALVAAALRSLLVAAASVAIATPLGAAAAFGVWGAPRMLRRAVLGLCMIPLLAPPGWSAAGLMLATSRSGIAGAHILALIAAHALPAASLVLLVLSGFLKRLDPAWLETAAAAGAGPIRAWRLVVLTRLATPILAATAVAFAASLGLALCDTALAPTLPTLGAVLTTAIHSNDTQAAPAALILTVIILSPLGLLGLLARLRRR